MKNFFKKLAFVLALAMVITAIAPAGKASAATEPTFKKSGKVLYVGGDETGNIGDTYRFYFNNAKGYTATWKSSKPSVATIDAKTGEIQAVAVGSAVIKATLTNKAGKAVELTTKVWVKRNVENIGWGSQAAVKEALAVGDTAKVNVYRQVGSTKVWKQTDKTLVTDVIKWSSSNPEVATVDKWGKVTAVAAGEALITATAVQSEGATPVMSKSYKVTVAAGLVDAKQTGLNTIEVKFAGDLSAVANKDNVKVYNVVGGTNVVVMVKELKFDATDKTKATITTYAELVKGVEYVVEYKETSKNFTGADTSKTAVASIKIETTEVKPQVETEIKFKVYDANGVDITKAEYTDLITVSFAEATNDAYLQGKKITFFSKDKVATIKASFPTLTYDPVTFKEITVDAVAQIVSKETAGATVNKVDNFTVYKTSGTPDFTKTKTTISISDTTNTYSVAAQTKDSKGNTLKSTDSGSKFTFESSDKNTLLVNGNVLYPIKEGGATVLVKYDNTVIGAYNVIIGAKRAVSTVSYSFDKTTLSKGNADDKVALTIEVLDQYEDKIDATASIVYFTGQKTVEVPSANISNDGNKTVITFNGSDYTDEGTYQYKFTVGGITRYAHFTVAESLTKAVSSYRFSNAGKSVDTAINVFESNDSLDFDMLFESYAANNYKIANVNILADKAAAVAGAADAYYVEILTPDNKVLSADNYTVTGNKLTIKPVIVGADSVIKKLAAGSYTVRAYAYDASEGTSKAVTIVNFIVKDTQVGAVANVKKNTFTGSAAAYVAAVQDADVVAFTINGKDKVNDALINTFVVSADKIGTGKEIAITKAKVQVPVTFAGATVKLELEATIGQTFAFTAE